MPKGWLDRRFRGASAGRGANLTFIVGVVALVGSDDEEAVVEGVTESETP